MERGRSSDVLRSFFRRHQHLWSRREKLELDIYELVGERFDKISPIIRLRSAANYLEIRYIDIWSAGVTYHATSRRYFLTTEE